MANGPFHKSPGVPDHFATSTTPSSTISSSTFSPSTSTSASGMTPPPSSVSAPTPPPKAAKPHNIHHHHQHDDDTPPVFRLHQHNPPPSHPHSPSPSPSHSPSPSPHPPSSSSSSYTSAARSLKNRAMSKLSSLVPLLREPSKSPLHISTDGVSAGASIITGLLHKLRSAPTQERNAVLCTRDSDMAMLSTFSGHGKHGVRLAELSASLVFRHVRRRMMISSSSSSSSSLSITTAEGEGRGGGVGGTELLYSYQQEMFSIERIVDDALIAVYRNVANTRWARNSNVSATVCVVSNGRLVVGACGLPTVLLVSKSSRSGTFVELVTGRKMMSSAQVKQQQKEQQEQKQRECERDERQRHPDRERERERDKEEDNDDEEEEEGEVVVVEVEQEEEDKGEGESTINKTMTAAVVVPKRRMSRAKRDAGVGATNDVDEDEDDGDNKQRSSKNGHKQYNKIDIDIDIDIDDDDDDDVVEEMNSDLEEEETSNVTDSDPSSSSSSSSMTARSFPRKRVVTINDDLVNKKHTHSQSHSHSHSHSQSYSYPHSSAPATAAADDTFNLHSNNMLNTILLSSPSARTLADFSSDDATTTTTSTTPLNVSVPQLHGRFSLPSASADGHDDSHTDGRRNTSMNNNNDVTSNNNNATMVLGTCPTPSIRSFELSSRHTHVIVSTTRLWPGDSEIAPQPISDVFAKASSQASVIDLAERVTETAFGGCAPTHDTTVLVARLRRR